MDYESVLARVENEDTLGARRTLLRRLLVAEMGKGSRVVWKSRFNAINSPEMDDAKVKALVAGIYRAGFDGLKEKLGER